MTLLDNREHDSNIEADAEFHARSCKEKEETISTSSMMNRADPMLLKLTERRARWAVLAMFAVDGFGFVMSAAQLPAFKSALGLSDGRLSVPLFGMVAGSLLAMPVAGRSSRPKRSQFGLHACSRRHLVLTNNCHYGEIFDHEHEVPLFFGGDRHRRHARWTRQDDRAGESPR